MFAVAAVLSGLSLVAFAAPTPMQGNGPLACGAIPFTSNFTYPDYFRITAYPTEFTAGQTITATVVDRSTCEPFVDLTGSNNMALIKLSGSALDADFKWDSPDVPATGKTVESNATISFPASVPNGSQNLIVAVIANFSPASEGRLEYVMGGLGVVYSAA